MKKILTDSDYDFRKATYPANFKFTVSIAGTTSTPTTLVVHCLNVDGSLRQLPAGTGLRVKALDQGSLTTCTNAVLAVGAGSSVLQTLTSNKDLVIKNKVGATATNTLTISGVVLHAQKITVGGVDWTFSTGLTSVTGKTIDISAGGVKAQGTLTLATNPTAGNWVTLGASTYVFRAVADQVGEIAIGVNAAATQTSLRTAVNTGDTFNLANPLVTLGAFASDISIVTARHTGVQGNSIPTVESLTEVNDGFDAAVLGTETAGVDVTATQAGAAIVAAFAGDATSLVTAVNTNGTVVLTAKVVGTSGNAIATTETMANGAFSPATLAGGVDEDLSAFVVTLTNATAADPVVLWLGPTPWGPSIVSTFAETQTVTHAA